MGSLIIGLICGERILHLWTIPVVLLLGYVAYGLSIYYYVYSQRILGAARTSAYYAVAPFIGVFLSLLIFREIPGPMFIAALLLMIIAPGFHPGTEFPGIINPSCIYAVPRYKNRGTFITSDF